MILRLTDEAPVSFARQRDRTHNLWSSTRWRAKAMLQCGIWSVLDGVVYGEREVLRLERLPWSLAPRASR